MNHSKSFSFRFRYEANHRPETLQTIENRVWYYGTRLNQLFWTDNVNTIEYYFNTFNELLKIRKGMVYFILRFGLRMLTFEISFKVPLLLCFIRISVVCLRDSLRCTNSKFVRVLQVRICAHFDVSGLAGYRYKYHSNILS